MRVTQGQSKQTSIYHYLSLVCEGFLLQQQADTIVITCFTLNTLIRYTFLIVIVNMCES